MHTLSLVLISSFLLLIITNGCLSAAFLSKWLLSPVGRRRQNPGSLWQCPALPPDMTYCSHTVASSDSVQEANVWITLLSSRCHPQTMKFVCTVYNPVCLHSHQVMPILPCREFCNEVRNACVARMYLFGFKWPHQVDCDRFPSEDNSMCISSKRESVTCTPCSQETSRENIVKQYCRADVVVKSQIFGVTAFGNTSSLLVNLDRVSEQLLPQPPIPTPGTHLKPNGLFASSTGFVDTNDERFLLMNQARRREFGFDPEKQAINEIIPQADQPVDSSIAARSQKPGAALELSKAEKRKRRREQRLRNKIGGKQRRDKRSPYALISPELEASLGQSMLLECAGCSLQLPTSPMAPNSATRWLVMAKKLNKSRMNLTHPAPNLQIISLMTWQKDDTGFRDALRDIRTIPKAILCNPNAKVELNLEGFHRNEVTTPKPLPMRPTIRTSWSRQGWMTMQRQPTPPWNLPAPFEGLFQNDAAVGNRKTKKQRRQMKRWRKQRQGAENAKGKEKPKVEDEKERKRRRRKARKEKLARMTPQQRDSWMARRRARRAQRQKLGDRSQHRTKDQINGSHTPPQ
ncbi:hypothetical protein Aperf_G00000068828 [Anoplocephala perfoliata]